MTLNPQDQRDLYDLAAALAEDLQERTADSESVRYHLTHSLELLRRYRELRKRIERNLVS